MYVALTADADRDFHEVMNRAATLGVRLNSLRDANRTALVDLGEDTLRGGQAKIGVTVGLYTYHQENNHSRCQQDVLTKLML